YILEGRIDANNSSHYVHFQHTLRHTTHLLCPHSLSLHAMEDTAYDRRRA
ncbi:hypothetical protein COCVIDRAFT_115266, partial [Bipolaris victoriae FI3]